MLSKKVLGWIGAALLSAAVIPAGFAQVNKHKQSNRTHAAARHVAPTSKLTTKTAAKKKLAAKRKLTAKKHAARKLATKKHGTSKLSERSAKHRPLHSGRTATKHLSTKSRTATRSTKLT